MSEITIAKDQTREWNHGLWADASALGLAPGVWPDIVRVIDPESGPCLFSRSITCIRGQEFDGYYYVAEDGSHLRIEND
jgi:hypothetical protein